MSLLYLEISACLLTPFSGPKEGARMGEVEPGTTPRLFYCPQFGEAIKLFRSYLQRRRPLTG